MKSEIFCYLKISSKFCDMFTNKNKIHQNKINSFFISFRIKKIQNIIKALSDKTRNAELIDANKVNIQEGGG